MFEWYIDDLPKRTTYLFDYMNRFSSIELNYTLDTFKKVIRIDVIKMKELKIEKRIHSDSVESVLKYRTLIKIQNY